MKKTRFSVEVYSKSSNGDWIFQMVSNHNNGDAVLTLPIIVGYINAMRVMFPSNDKETVCEYDNKFTLRITEKGKLTLVITEKEIVEIQEEINYQRIDSTWVEKQAEQQLINDEA